MSMNLGLLPEEYPNIYMKDMGRWVDMRYYEMEGEKVPAELWDMDKIDLWDEEYLILFATISSFFYRYEKLYVHY